MITVVSGLENTRVGWCRTSCTLHRQATGSMRQKRATSTVCETVRFGAFFLRSVDRCTYCAGGAPNAQCSTHHAMLIFTPEMSSASSLMPNQKSLHVNIITAASSRQPLSAKHCSLYR